MTTVFRRGLIGAATALGLLAAFDIPVPSASTRADAQSRNYNRWTGRGFQLHGKGFGRGEGGIYSGTRDSSTRGHDRYGYGRYGYGVNGRGVNGFRSPYVYTPYAAPPYAYDPSFVSPGYFGNGFHGGFVAPYSPYAVPIVGYGTRHFGVEVYGPGAAVGVGPSPIYAPAPVPLPTQTPVGYHVANSKEEAQRLRQMLRDEDPDRLPLPAVAPVFRESTPAEKLASVREEQSGDRDFQAGRYLLAFTHYKDAVSKAEDRADPRAKLVVTLATIGQYARATDALRSLLELDPQYPQHFHSLDSIFGDSQITKDAMKNLTAKWAADHAANPERLMLLGALMYFDGDIDRSRQLFDTVVLYDDLAPLVQGFIGHRPNGAGVGGVATPGPLGPLDVPEADIPADFIPEELRENVAPPLPSPR